MKTRISLLSAAVALACAACTPWNWNDPTPKPDPANHCTWHLVKVYYDTWLGRLGQDRWQCLPNRGTGWS